MRIAQVAPLYERVPPPLYGGTERVVSYLTEELVRLAHEVTLFASGDSETSARLVAGSPKALWRDPDVRETLPHHVHLMELVCREAGRFDVVHFHTDYVHFPLVRRHRWRSVTTLHGMVHPPDLGPLLREYEDVPLVSISNDQRSPIPHANWRATVYHGLPLDAFTFRPGPGTYLVYLGRMSPEKRVDRAIEIARRAGMPLKIAAKIYPEERGYFDEELAPPARVLAAARGVRGRDRQPRAGRTAGRGGSARLPDRVARALRAGHDRGHGLRDAHRRVAARVGARGRGGRRHGVRHGDDRGGRERGRPDRGVSRVACRRVFEERFGVARMARDYVEVYRGLITGC